MCASLADPAADERLHAGKEIASVVVIACGDYDGEIRMVGAGHYFGFAVRHRCQPKARSSTRNSARGIQRKYHTILYWYLTYSGMLYGKYGPP